MAIQNYIYFFIVGHCFNINCITISNNIPSCLSIFTPPTPTNPKFNIWGIDSSIFTFKILKERNSITSNSFSYRSGYNFNFFSGIITIIFKVMICKSIGFCRIDKRMGSKSWTNWKNHHRSIFRIRYNSSQICNPRYNFGFLV